MNGFTTEEEGRGGASGGGGAGGGAGHHQVCCLLEEGDRCRRLAGNASYSKRIEKTVQRRMLKLNIDPNVQHIYICDHHKDLIQSVRVRHKRKDSDADADAPEDLDVPDIDFLQMPVNTLRRYKRHYKLPNRPGLNKSQLADLVSKHFKTIPVFEKEALTFFIYMAKNYKSRFDSKHMETVSG